MGGLQIIQELFVISRLNGQSWNNIAPEEPKKRFDLFTCTLPFKFFSCWQRKGIYFNLSFVLETVNENSFESKCTKNNFKWKQKWIKPPSSDHTAPINDIAISALSIFFSCISYHSYETNNFSSEVLGHVLNSFPSLKRITHFFPTWQPFVKSVEHLLCVFLLYNVVFTPP